MADTMKIEIQSDGCLCADIGVKIGDGYAYVIIDDRSFEASAWSEIKAEVDRLLAMANAARAAKEQS